jgi:two-component system KDP operon response regulator KdpE
MNGKKVLIAEDHLDCRELLKIVLSRSGYTVIQVATGLEALERASATSPDLIVMDFGLPDVSGDKVIDQLKANPHTMKIPVIVTTGYMTTEVSNRAFAAGATTVLLKPYHVDELLEAIEHCLTTMTERDSPAQGRMPPRQIPLA